MRSAKRFVCDCCGAIHFAEVVEGQGGKCPTCKGTGKVRDVKVDEGGVVHVEPGK